MRVLSLLTRSTRTLPTSRLRVSARLYSSKITGQHLETSSDPDRPDVFYHLFRPPTPFSSKIAAYALSFLDKPPTKLDAAAIIGWLPAESETGSDADAGLNDFKENGAFRDILQASVKDGLNKDVDDIQRNGAMQIQSGWMHIHDNRNLPPLGRIGDPDDIIGTVLVEDSKILPETYQPMPAYRLCTVDGPPSLTPGLAQHLLATLNRLESSQ